jgi:tetratricopeptide (TPR) repeat protein
MRAAFALLSVVLVEATAPTLRAAAPEAGKSAPEQRAEAHYKRARELYQLGRYREAIAQLEAALRSDPGGAELLYNLGLVHEKLGDADEAIAAYRKYLVALGPDGDPEEVQKIKGAIRRLEGAKSELRAREAKRTEHRFTPLSGSLVIVSGLAAVGAGVFGVMALGQDSRARNFVIGSAPPSEADDSYAARARLVADARNNATLSTTFGVVALASAALGITLYFTSEYPRRDDPNEIVRQAALRVTPLPSGGSFSFEVGF